MRAPALLGGVSLEGTLVPRAARLSTLLALSEGGLGRLVARAPGLLLASEDAIQSHVDFLVDAGLSSVQLSTAVAAHPQVGCFRNNSTYLHLF